MLEVKKYILILKDEIEMKIVILYDSKYGNTKKLAEYIFQKVKTEGHDVRLFRTIETKPKQLIAFSPEALIVGGPTHFGQPAHKLSNYIKKLAKFTASSTPQYAGVFNCYTGEDVCDVIKNQISAVLPEMKILETTLPIVTGDGSGDNWKKVMLQENWEEETDKFISIFLDSIKK